MLAKASDGKHHRVPYDAAEIHVPQERYLPNNNSYSRSRAHERAMVKDMGRRAEQRISAYTTTGHYTGDELTRPSARPGADDHRRYPSRMGDLLTYLDGRRERFPGGGREVAA